MALNTWPCCSPSNYSIFFLPIFPNPLPRASLNPSRHDTPTEPPPTPCLSKRELGLSSLAFILTGFSPNLTMPMYAQELELERYTDSKEGFTLLRPSSWIKVFNIVINDLYSLLGILFLLFIYLFAWNSISLLGYGWFRLTKQGQLFFLRRLIRGVPIMLGL